MSASASAAPTVLYRFALHLLADAAARDERGEEAHHQVGRQPGAISGAVAVCCRPVRLAAATRGRIPMRILQQRALARHRSRKGVEWRCAIRWSLNPSLQSMCLAVHLQMTCTTGSRSGRNVSGGFKTEAMPASRTQDNFVQWLSRIYHTFETSRNLRNALGHGMTRHPYPTAGLMPEACVCTEQCASHQADFMIRIVYS